MEVESQKSSPGHHVLGERLFFVWRLRNAWIPLFFVARLNIYLSYFFWVKVAKFSTSTFQETEGTTLQGMNWDSFWWTTHGDFTAKTGAKRIYPLDRPARWVPTITYKWRKFLLPHKWPVLKNGFSWGYNSFLVELYIIALHITSIVPPCGGA